MYYVVLRKQRTNICALQKHLKAAALDFSSTETPMDNLFYSGSSVAESNWKRKRLDGAPSLRGYVQDAC